MNVFILSKNCQLLLRAEEKLSHAYNIYTAKNITELHQKVPVANPDIAFIDEELYSRDSINNIQELLLKNNIRIPITSLNNPFQTDYMKTIPDKDFVPLLNSVREITAAADITERLSPQQSELLNYFLSHKGELLSTTMLVQHLWERVTDGHLKTLYTYICQLREILRKTESCYTIRRDSKGCYMITKKA